MSNRPPAAAFARTCLEQLSESLQLLFGCSLACSFTRLIRLKRHQWQAGHGSSRSSRHRSRDSCKNNNDNDIDNETTTPNARENNSQTPPIRLYYHSKSMPDCVCECVCAWACANMCVPAFASLLALSYPSRCLTKLSHHILFYSYFAIICRLFLLSFRRFSTHC